MGQAPCGGAKRRRKAYVQNNKFLINRKRGTKFFLLPGGKPKAGELIEDCLAREIHEEHQCKVVLNSLKFLGKFEDLAANEPNTIIHINFYQGEIIGQPMPSAEIEEQRWFGIEDDPEILSPLLKNKILPVLIKQKIIR